MKWHVELVLDPGYQSIIDAPNPLQAALILRTMFKLPLEGCTCHVWAHDQDATVYLQARGLVAPIVAGW